MYPVYKCVCILTILIKIFDLFVGLHFENKDPFAVTGKMKYKGRLIPSSSFSYAMDFIGVSFIL